MSLPYIYTPRPGEEISVSSVYGDAVAGARGCRVIISSEHIASMRIPASDVPGVAAGIAGAMHEAAGLPAPVILERPATSAWGTATPLGVIYSYTSATVTGAEHLIGVGDSPGLGPSQARDVAAILAAYADAPADAEDGPDAADVKALAGVLADVDLPPGVCETAEGIARRILLAGYRREAGS